jgi:hypothetical protein
VTAPRIAEIQHAVARRKKPETKRVHQAVVALRRSGHAVYRAGWGATSIDGKVVSNNSVWQWGVSPQS